MIEGQVEPGFERVRDAFAENFEARGDIGAGCAVYVDGRLVVDLVGGVADPRSGRPYSADTLQVVFSATKGAVATVAHVLAERGMIDVDAPVAQYWPEFAENGKGSIPVRWLLSHQAGLYAMDGWPGNRSPLEWEWDDVCAALARQAPLFEPGSAFGYHAITFGFLLGEVVRRVTGRTIGAVFQDEVAKPLGLDFWIGLPAAEHHRVAPLLADDQPTDPAMDALLDQLMGADTPFGRAMMIRDRSDLGNTDAMNDPAFWSKEIPAINGVTNARSLARMYASLISDVDGIRLLSRNTVERATTNQVSGGNVVLFDQPTRIGLGYILPSESSARMGGEHSFGHAGMGGSLGFADPDRGVAFGYVMNQMRGGIGSDPRPTALIEALDSVL